MARKKIPVVAEPEAKEEPTSTCKACRHAWFLEDEESTVWLCRRYPPTVTYDYEEGVPCSSFPVVASDLTCGEFAAKLNS